MGERVWTEKKFEENEFSSYIFTGFQGSVKDSAELEDSRCCNECRASKGMSSFECFAGELLKSAEFNFEALQVKKILQFQLFCAHLQIVSGICHK